MQSIGAWSLNHHITPSLGLSPNLPQFLAILGLVESPQPSIIFSPQHHHRCLLVVYIFFPPLPLSLCCRCCCFATTIIVAFFAQLTSSLHLHCHHFHIAAAVIVVFMSHHRQYQWKIVCVNVGWNEGREVSWVHGFKWLKKRRKQMRNKIRFLCITMVN